MRLFKILIFILFFAGPLYSQDPNISVLFENKFENSFNTNDYFISEYKVTIYDKNGNYLDFFDLTNMTVDPQGFQSNYYETFIFPLSKFPLKIKISSTVKEVNTGVLCDNNANNNNPNYYDFIYTVYYDNLFDQYIGAQYASSSATICQGTTTMTLLTLANNNIKTISNCDNIEIFHNYFSNDTAPLKWQYRLGGNSVWNDLQENLVSNNLPDNNLYFKVSDISGLEGYKGTIDFRFKIDPLPVDVPFELPYQKVAYSSIISYEIKGCSPKIVSQSPLVDNKCFDGNQGSLYYQFDRPLSNGEVLNLSYKVNGIPYGKNINNLNATNGYLLDGLYNGNYSEIKFQSVINGVDSGITQGNDFIITSPSKVTFSVSQTNVLCHGAATGAITVTASGGTGNYQYSKDGGATWQTSNVFTGLVAGNYLVVVKDVNSGADCIAPDGNQQVVITQPASPLVIQLVTAVNPSSDVSADGSIDVKVTGGTGNYTYLWSSSANNISGQSTQEDLSGLAGDATYTLTVKDENNCTAVFNQTLDAPDPLQVTFTHASNDCYLGKENITANVTGGVTPYNLIWNTGQTSSGDTSTLLGASPNVYGFQVIDANGASIFPQPTFTIPAINIVGLNTSIIGGVSTVEQKCFGNNSDNFIDVTVNGGNAPYSYSWVDLANPTEVIATTEDLLNVAPGQYKLEVKDANNFKFCKNFNVLTASQLTFTTSKTDIIDPGTTTGRIDVNPNGGTGSYEFSTNGTNWQSDAAFSNLAAGNYTVYVKDTNDCIVGPQTVLITEPAAFTIGITLLNSISCFGVNDGSLKAIATGGTPPYTYTWSDTNGNNYTGETISNLPDEIYTVTVADSNGVTRISSNYSLVQPTLLAGATTKTDVKCNGENNGSITFTASGGTAPYKYYVNGTLYAGATVTGLAPGTYTCEIKDDKNCSLPLPTITINEPSILNVTGAIYPVSNGTATDGSITVTVTGGTPPYTYTWPSNPTNTTNVLSNLGVGTYNVTVTDAKGCSITESYTVTTIQPLAVNLNAANSITSINCFGDTNAKLEAIGSGGRPSLTAPNYLYEWRNGLNQVVGTSASITGLAAGTYTVYVSDFNTPPSTIQQSFTITQPASLLTATLQITNPILCAGETGSLSVSPNGGTPTYTYEWKNSANTVVGTTSVVNYLVAGTYTCKVTDANGCSLTQTITLTSPSALNATYSQVNVLINGQSTGSITINASGGTAPYTYLLNGNPQPTNQFTNLPAGTYTVLVQDANNCIWTTTVVITQPAPLAIVLTQLGQIACFGGNSVTLNTVVTGGIAPYYYQWKKDGSIIPNAITASLLNVAAGNYEVIVTDNVGAIRNSTITVSQPQELKATYTTTQVSCAATNSGSVTLQVTGGTAPYSYSWNTGTSTTNILSNVPIGTYSVVIIDAKGCSLTVSNINITSNTGLNIGATVNDVTCGNVNNGSITINPTGGTGNYTIVWDNANYSGFVLTNLAPGNYSGKLIDGVCNLPFNFNIQGTNPLTVDLGADVVLCAGQSHTIDATVTGQTLAYEWTSTNGFTSNNSMVNLTESGIYTLTITTSSGCTYSDAVEITKLGESIESKSMVASQLIKDQEIIMVNISERNNNTYQWIIPSQAQIISQTDDALVVKFAEIGKYNIGLKASNQSGCESLEYKEILVEEGDGSTVDTGTIFIKQFTIFPNPIEAISNEFNVLAELAYEMPVTLSIYRLEQGVLINEVHLPAAKIHSKQFNLNLSSGVYLVVLKTPGSIQAKKIIKN